MASPTTCWTWPTRSMPPVRDVMVMGVGVGDGVGMGRAAVGVGKGVPVASPTTCWTWPTRGKTTQWPGMWRTPSPSWTASWPGDGCPSWRGGRGCTVHPAVDALPQPGALREIQGDGEGGIAVGQGLAFPVVLGDGLPPGGGSPPSSRTAGCGRSFSPAFGRRACPSCGRRWSGWTRTPPGASIPMMRSAPSGRCRPAAVRCAPRPAHAPAPPGCGGGHAARP